MRFVIVSGMSGAGKSTTLKMLEDVGYFCADNLPVPLIPKFAELCRQTSEKNVALVVDVRGGQFFDKLLQVLDEIKASGQKYELLFLDADDATIVRRFKETRRRHPLGDSETLLDNLAKERELLEPLLEKATYIINTSELNSTELKNKISELFSTDTERERMGIVVRSFGFKYGLPLDSDLVLDVRFLPDPFYVEELRHQTGNDQPVVDYICRYPQTFEYLKLEAKRFDFLIPQYINEGKSQLVISVGCTGGQHRSVFVANKLAEYLGTQGYKVEVSHRELSDKK